MKTKRRTLRHEALPPMMLMTPLSLISSIPIQETCKIFSKDTFKEVVKGMRELKVKKSELKESQRDTSLHAFEESKEFVKKCIYYDSLQYEKKITLIIMKI